eukprot:scaffold53948_cov40-Prasinocladus_malaysianus.AAC.2
MSKKHFELCYHEVDASSIIIAGAHAGQANLDVSHGRRLLKARLGLPDCCRWLMIAHCLNRLSSQCWATSTRSNRYPWKPLRPYLSS